MIDPLCKGCSYEVTELSELGYCQNCQSAYYLGSISKRASEHTKQEILDITDSDKSFSHFIEGIDTLEGQTLGLVLDVAGVDGEDLTDYECLEIIKSILDLADSYRSRERGQWDE